MLPLEDSTWKRLSGGYKVPYDASPALARLEAGEDVWDELWQELHHQGDVGEASYAAVPHLARIAKRQTKPDWNLYALASTIEIERHRKTNPPLPAWLVEDYDAAWRSLMETALDHLRVADDPCTVRSILAAIALAKGRVKLGALLCYSDESEIDEILERYDAWTETYG
jgi:hypothetical protein